MTTAQKHEAVEVLKEKFSQYDNFYITNTESLTVAQIGKLRRTCFEKGVEMKVAKNTLIRKALESLNSEKYAGIFEALNGVTALMFTDTPKEPAVILSSFRTASKGKKPELKAAFIGEDFYIGDDQLVSLKNIKTKNELIGEVIGLLQSPARRVIAALLENIGKERSEAPADEATNTDTAVADEATKVEGAAATEGTATDAPTTEA